MTSSTTFDRRMERIAAGERMTADDLRELADTADVLPLGMLADALRRRIHGTRVTYVRVASCAFDHSFADAVLPMAREVLVTGTPDSLSTAVSAVASARAVAGSRCVAGFSWPIIERLASGHHLSTVLERLREAGLDAVAELPLDVVDDAAGAVERLKKAGFQQLRLTLEKGAASDRTPLFARASELHDRFACIQALNPLPMSLNAFRPTTGYADVKMVALARLAAPNIPSIQIDWPRYGPKLAQVALTFGADDLYGISPSDDAPEGRRRAPLEEIRRNIEAAGFQPAERDGRFTVTSDT